MSTAYITAADVIAAMPRSTRPDIASSDEEDVDKVARITTLCETTAEMIDAEIAGVSFHRHPVDEADADVAIVVDGRGLSMLHVHRGVLSLSSVAIRYSRASEWEEVEATDYELVSMFEAEDPDRPYDHVLFTIRLPAIANGVRLTGHFGWDQAPARLREANIAWVRQHLAAGDSYSGAAQLPDGSFQTPRLVLPDDVRMLLVRESRRYQECWT